MSLSSRRTDADLAALRQYLCRRELETTWQPCKQDLQLRRPWWMIGASLLGGALVARLPGRAVLGSFSTLMGIASFAIRTPFLSLAVSRLARRGFKKG